MLKAIVLVLTVNCCQAADVFNFMSDGDVLATLELQHLPANPADVVSLTFSESGQDVFGFGPLYAGEFDLISSDNGGMWVLSPDGGLGGFDADNVRSIGFEDTSPPTSTAFSNPLVGFFLIAGQSNPDFMGLAYPNSVGSFDIFRVEGAFRPVPEPSSGVIFFLLLLMMDQVRNFVREGPGNQ